MASFDQFDVTVVGNGLVGMALIKALAGSRYRVALIASQPPPSLPVGAWTSRIYALTPASVSFLQDLGVWPHLPHARLTPVQRMNIFGRKGGFLKLSAYEETVSELAWIVESDVLCATLAQALSHQTSLTILQDTPDKLAIDEKKACISLKSGRVVSTSLLIGADGANSWTRVAAGIGMQWHHIYDTHALVANFACSKPHENTAFQWFSDSGIMAWLPLTEDQVSIVWSRPAAFAEMTNETEDLSQQVANLGRHRLGNMTALNTPHTFPLSVSRSQSLCQSRLALLGDAAHTVHPLSGHGANLGLADAKILGQVLTTNAEWVDCGDRWLLRKYERQRSEQILTLQSFTHAVAWMSQGKRRQALGDGALMLAQNAPLIKNFLARYAMNI